MRNVGEAEAVRSLRALMAAWIVLAFGLPILFLPAPSWLDHLAYRVVAWVAVAVMGAVASLLWLWRRLAIRSPVLRSTFGLSGVVGFLTSGIYRSWLAAIIGVGVLLGTAFLARASRRADSDLGQR